MKICIISTAAIPAFPDKNLYSGAEVVISNLAIELAKSPKKHQVYVISAKGSTMAGLWEYEDENTHEKLGTLEVRETIMPSMNDVLSELNHYLSYKEWLEHNFGEGQGVILDSTWQMFSYFSVSGYNDDILGQGHLEVLPHPKMKIIHIHHGAPNSASRPPNVPHPRILGLSRIHAALLSQAMRTPARFMWNGIPLPNVTPEQCPRDNGNKWINDGKPYLLSLNRMTEEKGIHDSIDIAVQNGVDIIVAGDDILVRDQGYVSQIVEMCRRSNQRAIYYGSIDNHTKEQLLKHCMGVISCPYTQGIKAWVEAFGLNVVEGLSYYKPFIGSSNGGHVDIIEHGKHGFLGFNPGEISPYVSKLNEIDGNVCRQRVEELFTVEKMAQRYETLFEQVDKENPNFNW